METQCDLRPVYYCNCTQMKDKIWTEVVLFYRTVHLAMLKDRVIPQLKQRRALSRTIFMKNGAPPHFATNVRLM